MLFRLLPIPLCYEGFYAYKRSAKSQTLKVHPVASKTLTQKIPVYAAPERLVSFSIVFFLGMVTCPYPNVQMDQSVEPLRYVRVAVTLSLPHTHTLNLFPAAAPPSSPP